MSEATPEAAAAQAPAKAPNPWIPVIAVIVIMPAISFAMTQYVLIPKIKGTVAEHEIKTATTATHGEKPAANGEKSTKAAGHGGEKKGEGNAGAFSYDFENLVVNLSGAMGTRYLKASFTAFSSDPEVKTIITQNKSQLLDVALGVLSSKSLADLESPGAKNVVRHDLIESLNQALNTSLIEQIYFSDFVVQ
jgi:flagellar FliL protein